MLSVSYHNLKGNQVGESIPLNTDDIEFATLQVIAVENVWVIRKAKHFIVLGDDNKRMVIGYG